MVHKKVAYHCWMQAFWASPDILEFFSVLVHLIECNCNPSPDMPGVTGKFRDAWGWYHYRTTWILQDGDFFHPSHSIGSMEVKFKASTENDFIQNIYSCRGVSYTFRSPTHFVLYWFLPTDILSFHILFHWLATMDIIDFIWLYCDTFWYTMWKRPLNTRPHIQVGQFHLKVSQQGDDGVRCIAIIA